MSPAETPAEPADANRARTDAAASAPPPPSHPLDDVPTRALVATQLRSVPTWAIAVVAALAAAWLLAGVVAVPVVLAGVVLAVGLTFLAAVDLRAHRLPDVLVAITTTAVGALLVVAAAVGGTWGSLEEAVATAVGSLLVYLVLAVAGLGLGDLKLAGLLGLWLGWFGWEHALAGALAGFLLGGVWAVVLLVARRAHRKTPIAFGPWMILGGAVATVLAVTGTTY